MQLRVDTDLDNLLEQLRHLQGAHIRLIVWLGTRHKINGSYIVGSQTYLAQEYGVTVKRMNHMITVLRQRGFVATGSTDKGEKILVMNPAYFNFGDSKAVGYQAHLWKKYRKTEATDKLQADNIIDELINA